MKTYIIHLRPESYGFEIQAEDKDSAIKQVQDRWHKKQDYDFDVCDSQWEIVAEF